MRAAGICALLVAAGMLFAATACRREPGVVVGSKNFTEQIVLGEIAAQQIEKVAGRRVRRQLDLGGTLLAHQALVAGQIDLYPEYTGTALTSVLKQTAVRREDVFARVAAIYRRRFDLDWLPPLGFEDTFAMVVRREDAQALPAARLSAADRHAWRLGVGYEFLTRPDGLRQLIHTYPLQWRGLPQTMDLGLLYRALSQRQIDMAAANSTDGLLLSPNFVVLADDRHAFPPYDACFVVRRQALARFPAIARALQPLSGKLTADAMRRLNWQVDREHHPVVQVAAQFLRSLR